ncbi:cysteine synthase A [Myxococcota bacterium]|nr:cysteine synthase A [Myxococcota bacterium]MBU1381427.1 cysteine synthase A [Myxococcota bacterium]MBU1498333.1 cysteine synthase A [Myxococcota bacterium]
MQNDYSRPKIADNMTELVGNTPMVRICDDNLNLQANLIAKLEYFNPLSSVKDRIALSMVDDAVSRGLVKEGTVIVEPTSGNTGIGIAWVCSVRKIACILVMPETMSIERRKLLAALGAKIVLTPGSEGMKGAIAKAREITETSENHILLMQFENPANPAIHRKTTAREIWDDTDGNIDIFVSGVGTGGTVTGCGLELKQRKPEVKIVAVEPVTSAVLSGNAPGPHKIQGIGAGFIPGICDTGVIDEIITVADDKAGETARYLAKSHGILCGISSGAAAAAAISLAQMPENAGKNIVVILPDTGERYLSTWLYDQA